MSPGAALLSSVLVALGVGSLGALLTWWLARDSMRWAALAAPLVAVLTMAAGTFWGVRTMAFGGQQTGPLVGIVVASLIIALLTGALLAWRVARVEMERLRREVAAERLRESERARREVIAWMSHDLRTPLAGIKAMAEALEDGVGDARSEYPQRIAHEAARTAALADDLLDLSAWQSGIAPRTEPVSVSDLVSDVLASGRPVAEAAGVTLTGSSDGGTVDASASQLERALDNLVANAIRHSAGGSVEVTARHGADAVEIAVTDSCGGLEAEDLPRLFDAGWQKESARTPGAGRSAGLGLAIVQAVAISHGGTTSARNVEGGCRIGFTVALPQG